MNLDMIRKAVIHSLTIGPNRFSFASFKFEDLLGEIITQVDTGGEHVTIVLESGITVYLQHFQDCCERVYLEDINGDISDLIGSPVLLAEESSSPDAPDGYQFDYHPESMTWTFYRLGTIKGTVVLRWFGESNGYYSESVDIIVNALSTIPESIRGFIPQNEDGWAVLADGLMESSSAYWRRIGLELAMAAKEKSDRREREALTATETESQ